MTTHSYSSRSAIAVVGALAVTAVSAIVEAAPGQDISFPLFILGGPVLTGAIVTARGQGWRPAAAAWALAALGWLVFDWAINHEDVAFHAVLALLLALLVALGAAFGRAIARRRPA
jgi:hypothetical protein